MGGFRVSINSSKQPMVVALVTTGNEIDWPDNLDVYQGSFTYFGDNRSPGHDLHDTPRKGNQYLKSIFQFAHSDPSGRESCPIILIFSSSGIGRDMYFRGLAVPGGSNIGST